MRKTATHISSSPNPAQLEMRILANYGGDKRFAFLRGRWTRFWKLEKARAGAEAEALRRTQEDERSGAGLVGLADYGDSDQDGEEDSGGDEGQESNGKSSVDLENNKVIEGIRGECQAEGVDESDAAIKEARRARAKEWTKKRRASTSGKV